MKVFDSQAARDSPEADDEAMTRAQRREQQEVAVLEAARAQLAVRAVVRQVRALVTQAAAILLLLLIGCRRPIAADVTDLAAEAAADERRAD